MQLQIIGTNTDVPDDLKQYIGDELSKYETIYDLISASIKLTDKASKDNDHAWRVEMTITEPGHAFHSEHNGNSFESAFDAAMAKMSQQLKKLKTKRQDAGRHHPGLADIVNAQYMEEAAAAEPARQSIVLEKFNIKPMSEQEAVMQLKLAKRDFFIFLNGQNQVNCVYNRADGNIGLLLPETEVG